MSEEKNIGAVPPTTINVYDLVRRIRSATSGTTIVSDGGEQPYYGTVSIVIQHGQVAVMKKEETLK